MRSDRDRLHSRTVTCTDIWPLAARLRLFVSMAQCHPDSRQALPSFVSICFMHSFLTVLEALESRHSRPSPPNARAIHALAVTGAPFSPISFPNGRVHGLLDLAIQPLRLIRVSSCRSSRPCTRIKETRMRSDHSRLRLRRSCPRAHLALRTQRLDATRTHARCSHPSTLPTSDT
ncbi:hypothetical protein B0H16DRAFT_870157 [Mycena metata]|uniref:Uncharacterized protein n=1 Tax=Mycena metata TaxID=1033252 RepID=A0AAD7IT16_9AGAR|nr:hypothetical protein B0H16DRAFT_870157 [Mycena metata]